MRLHHLTITAFGPFAGTERIDFDALSDAGLFLINGPTGAGKTSVLDAVCFALYGRVPSVRNDAKNLRSHHAPPDRSPEVVCEVTIRGRRFRIARSPRWDRPKLRGTGTTEEKAKVLLQEWRAGEWAALSTRFDEAGQLIGDLLGMSAEQFCQVVLLPQGDFAAFLRADAEKRRTVLERLFATEIFTDVEKWLREKRQETGREAEILRAAAASTADRAAEAAGGERPDLDPDALAAWTVELSAHMDDVRAAAEDRVTAAAGVLSAARAAAERGRALADRRARRAAAEAGAAALAERAGERAALAGALRDAERARRVLPLLHAAEARAARREQAAAVVARQRDAVTRLVPDTADADVMRKEERARRDEAAVLEQRRDDERRLADLGRDLKRAESEGQDLDAREAELSLFLTDSPRYRRTLAGQLEQTRSRLAARPVAEAAVDAARRRLEAAERRDALVTALAEAEEEHRAATDAAQTAREAYQEIRQARLDGMAAWLARELTPGGPCAVCGSTDHPAPATADLDLPDGEVEAAAQAAYEQAREDRERIAARLAELRAEHAGAARDAGEEVADDLRAALAAAQGELTDLTAAETDAERLEEELRQVDAEYEEARDRQEEVRAALAENRAQRVALTAESLRLRTGLDDARGDDPTLEARIRRLGAEADLLRDTAAAIERLRAAVDDAGAAEREAADAAEAEGFPSVEAVRSATLDDAAHEELTRRAKAYDDEEARVTALLNDPDLAAAAAEPPPDLDVLEAALADADQAHQAVASARDRARHRRDRLAALAAELRRHAAAWRPVAGHHELVSRMAALASGDPAVNTARMRLSAYVLAARLEQVVARANHRLARMSQSRYVLEHTVERAAGERGRHGTGGLGLRVIDGWTGQHRDPATLSGGETFMASLALALGLADVVTDEAGGAEIGTLFVDEGFGTLDEETLDEVMDVLDGLRDGGRAVGIVSHVAELRTRIPTQLRVRKTRTGSTLAVTGGGQDATASRTAGTIS
ncbi:SMC family ATPase [Actinoallomurus rhizosphaericola]|uniref:SMC family ATPase n=1 Tax=Actinoallomurus rhizosphaericola TaxID=2952536 RepID=UPI0027E234B5|nr:SMC family ATPase [Actinoallomurus rhizosphaericola]